VPIQRALHTWLVPKSFGDVAVGINTAIAEERPPATGLFAPFWIDLGGDDFFFVGACLRYHIAIRISNKTIAPEFNAAIFGTFMANAVNRADIYAVGNGVRTLHGHPAI